MSDDELAAIRRRKMEELMRRARQPPVPAVAEPLANGQVNVLNDANFWPTIQQTGIAIVDFYAEWCGPCKALAPMMVELAQKYKGKVFFGKIDIDRNPRVAAQFRVQSVPIVHIFEKGRPTRSVLGLRPFNDYEALIQRLLKDHGRQA